DAVGGYDVVNSIDLIGNALATGRFDNAVLRQLGNRFGEALRVIAICLLVGVLAAFPHGRRGGNEVPIEIVVILAAFIERGFTVSFSLPTPLLPFSGPVVLILVCLLVLAWRMRPRAAEAARPAGASA